jgi:hypothetical protein
MNITKNHMLLAAGALALYWFVLRKGSPMSAPNVGPQLAASGTMTPAAFNRVTDDQLPQQVPFQQVLS